MTIGTPNLVDQYDRDGFAVVPLVGDAEYAELVGAARSRLNEIAAKRNVAVSFQTLALEDYHRLGISDEDHRWMMSPNNRKLFLTPAQQVMLLNATLRPILLHHFGHANVLLKDLVDDQWIRGACGFRVIRPNTRDVSGVHSESSYGIHPVTIWMPLAGFDGRYTLKLAPKSHKIRHPPDAIRIEEGFMARPYSDEYVRRFHFIRPTMRPGEAIVFHPDLIHGGSQNLGDSSRVSLEVRVYESEPDNRCG